MNRILHVLNYSLINDGNAVNLASVKKLKVLQIYTLLVGIICSSSLRAVAGWKKDMFSYGVSSFAL